LHRIYIADIPFDNRIWLTLPEVGIPQKNGTRGRDPYVEKVLDKDNDTIKVDKIAKDLDTSKWYKIKKLISYIP